MSNLNLLSECIIAGIADIMYKNRIVKYKWMNKEEQAAYRVGVSIAKKALSN